MPLLATSTAIVTKWWATQASSWSRSSIGAPSPNVPSFPRKLKPVLPMACGLGGGAIRRSSGANSLCKSPRQMARHLYDPRICGNLIENRQQPFGLRKRKLSQVIFELMKRIIHAQPVVLQPLLEDRKVALLLEEAFKNERELLRRTV